MYNMILIIFTIFVALFFDFLNGFHDAANSIATIVSTRVLKPRTAVIWAAFFNLIAFLIFKVHVATMIGTGIVQGNIVDTYLILAALWGAIVWNLVTWFLGIPSSSSHALVGGLVGAGVVKAGFSVLEWEGLFKILISIVLSPLLGWLLGLFFMFVITWLCVNKTPRWMDVVFRRLQLFSAMLISLGHGGNDAQKTMGIIAALLFSAQWIGPHFYVPFWVILLCNLVIALGTLFGGWRIVKTLGMKITKLRPVHGFCAETGGGLTLFLATYLGIPVSTTHTITGAVMGVGSVYRFSAVRWGVARRIVIAWVVTLPAAAIVAGLLECLFIKL